MPPGDAAADTPLADWRYVLGRIEARFRAPSFTDAATLVARICAEAEAADHHPDVDLRYPGVVSVALTTHDQHTVTNLDERLARTISAAAADLGCRAETTALQAIEIAIDAVDIDAIVPFWRAVLGYENAPGAGTEDPVRVLVDPLRRQPTVWFQQMDQARTDRNRIHFDVSVPHDAAPARLDSALAAGGRLVSDRRARAFWVLADAEGNEVCLCTWQDRG